MFTSRSAALVLTLPFVLLMTSCGDGGSGTGGSRGYTRREWVERGNG
ncbi:MAG: hypothetical protein IPK82_30205 [Polyangiaceae bacterium]|nr:hypothetical protein [Polyangiaceae bacterium]